MPIIPPSLADLTYDDLVSEMVARIPAHTPEWTSPAPGDPGRTLIELFAWLADTLLYRANLIPERQRLAFLRLLGVPLRPAIAARGVVTVLNDEKIADVAMLPARCTVRGQGPAVFETGNELTVLPVTAEAYCKRPLTIDEAKTLAGVVDGLREVYRLSGTPTPYVTTPVFAGDRPEPGGFDLMSRTVDHSLWLALLAPTPQLRAAARLALGGTTPAGAPRVLSVGVSPQLAVPALFEEIGPRSAIPHVWEMSGVGPTGEPRYFQLDTLTAADTTAGLTREGVIRLVLPTIDEAIDLPGTVRRIMAPANDVRDAIDAGVGDRPPRLDDAKKAARLVAWLRLRPVGSPHELSLSWVGINAVEADQRRTVNGRVIGQSDGAADQVMKLPGASVERSTLVLQVEEPGNGYRQWYPVDDLGLAGRDDPVFILDDEAGTVQFGDDVRGRIPATGVRVRVDRVRFGGGRAGNLAAGSLAKIETPPSVAGKFRVGQPLPTAGGEDAEDIVQAERRIPQIFRDRDRAVTVEDYRRIAADTPGLRVGRVEIMPRFKPQQRRLDVPGVVTVMTLPARDRLVPPAPRPDRTFLERVHAYIDSRRPLATELYVIGCEYVALGVGVAVTIRDGHGRDTVLQAVQEALRAFLWPLVPGGHDGSGWTLGRAVNDREIDVAVARVPGVARVNGVSLFRQGENDWELIRPLDMCGPATLPLDPWQLPELLSVVVLDADSAPEDLRGVPNPFAADGGIAVPVVPEVC